MCARVRACVCVCVYARARARARVRVRVCVRVRVLVLCVCVRVYMCVQREQLPGLAAEVKQRPNTARTTLHNILYFSSGEEFARILYWNITLYSQKAGRREMNEPHDFFVRSLILVNKARSLNLWI